MIQNTNSLKTLPHTFHLRLRKRTLIKKNNALKEVFMPALSSTMTEGKIVSWLKGEGDKITKGESLVVIESDKADMDVDSFDDGILAAVMIQEGESASVGTPIAFIAESEAEVAEAKMKAAGTDATSTHSTTPTKPTAAPQTTTTTHTNTPTPSSSAPSSTKNTSDRIMASPYAKQLASKLRVDLGEITGTGRYGRIIAEDVERVTNKSTEVVPVATVNAYTTKTNNATESELRGTTVPFNSIQKAVANNMLLSLEVPEFRVACSIYVDALQALAKKHKPAGLTMTVLLVKACGLALSKNEIINACTVADGIQYNNEVNVSVAVAMAEGLITPVIKNADTVDIYEISRRWSDLVKRARSKQLQVQEYNCGTFTISNLGMYGVDCFDAILPPGTGAILAVSGSKPTVVADDQGTIAIKKVMQVNLTADHRHIYGAHAAKFLQILKVILEYPEKYLFY